MLSPEERKISISMLWISLGRDHLGLLFPVGSCNYSRKYSGILVRRFSLGSPTRGWLDAVCAARRHDGKASVLLGFALARPPQAPEPYLFSSPGVCIARCAGFSCDVIPKKYKGRG